MKSIELFNELTEEQKELLEIASGGKEVSKENLGEIKRNLKRMHRDYMLWEISQMKDEISEITEVSIATDVTENLYKVSRYVDSFSSNESNESFNETESVDAVILMEKLFEK